jgi:membrane associated rhomboid family serine protease
VDDGRSRRGEAREPIFNLTPMVKALLAVNIVVHVLRLALSPEADDAVVSSFGFIAARFTQDGVFDWTAPASLLTYQFLHDGFAHLAVNMAFAMAVGTACERRLGSWRMLALALASGVAGALAHLAVYPHDPIVLIGFSGATSGLLGATLVFVYGATGPAGWQRFSLFSAIWIAINVATGLTGWPFGSELQIAWVAHIGGYVAGVVLAWVLDPRGRHWSL